MRGIISPAGTVLSATRSLISLLADLSDILSGVFLLQERREKKPIQPHSVYSTIEIARYLGTDRKTIIKEIRAGRLPAEQVGENYSISGQSVLDFLGGRTFSSAGTEKESSSGS